MAFGDDAYTFAAPARGALAVRLHRHHDRRRRHGHRRAGARRARRAARARPRRARRRRRLGPHASPAAADALRCAPLPRRPTPTPRPHPTPTWAAVWAVAETATDARRAGRRDDVGRGERTSSHGVAASARGARARRPGAVEQLMTEDSDADLVCCPGCGAAARRPSHAARLARRPTSPAWRRRRRRWRSTARRRSSVGVRLMGPGHVTGLQPGAGHPHGPDAGLAGVRAELLPARRARRAEPAVAVHAGVAPTPASACGRGCASSSCACRPACRLDPPRRGSLPVLVDRRRRPTRAPSCPTSPTAGRGPTPRSPPATRRGRRRRRSTDRLLDRAPRPHAVAPRVRADPRARPPTTSPASCRRSSSAAWPVSASTSRRPRRHSCARRGRSSEGAELDASSCRCTTRGSSPPAPHGDFQSLALLLRARPLPPGVGERRIDVSASGRRRRPSRTAPPWPLGGALATRRRPADRDWPDEAVHDAVPHGAGRRAQRPRRRCPRRTCRCWPRRATAATQSRRATRSIRRSTGAGTSSSTSSPAARVAAQFGDAPRAGAPGGAGGRRRGTRPPRSPTSTPCCVTPSSAAPSAGACTAGTSTAMAPEAGLQVVAPAQARLSRTVGRQRRRTPGSSRMFAAAAGAGGGARHGDAPSRPPAGRDQPPRRPAGRTGGHGRQPARSSPACDRRTRDGPAGDLAGDATAWRRSSGSPWRCNATHRHHVGRGRAPTRSAPAPGDPASPHAARRRGLAQPGRRPADRADPSRSTADPARRRRPPTGRRADGRPTATGRWTARRSSRSAPVERPVRRPPRRPATEPFDPFPGPDRPEIPDPGSGRRARPRSPIDSADAAAVPDARGRPPPALRPPPAASAVHRPIRRPSLGALFDEVAGAHRARRRRSPPESRLRGRPGRRRPGPSDEPLALDTVGFTPHFPQPLAPALAELGQDLMLPGLERRPAQHGRAAARPTPRSSRRCSSASTPSSAASSCGGSSRRR